MSALKNKREKETDGLGPVPDRLGVGLVGRDRRFTGPGRFPGASFFNRRGNARNSVQSIATRAPMPGGRELLRAASLRREMPGSQQRSLIVSGQAGNGAALARDLNAWVRESFQRGRVGEGRRLLFVVLVPQLPASRSRGGAVINLPVEGPILRCRRPISTCTPSAVRERPGPGFQLEALYVNSARSRWSPELPPRRWMSFSKPTPRARSSPKL